MILYNIRMKPVRLSPALLALLAALLFGASAPLSKLLLGSVSPVPLAALLYLGSGAGALLLRAIFQWRKPASKEAPLSKKDLPWLAGAVAAGGIAAPILLLIGLDRTPAASASLLLNFEGAATVMIAWLIFREAIGRRIALAVGLVTFASILLTWTVGGNFGVSLGALAVISATILWGFDNNFTHNISARDPLLVVMVKGFAAGLFNLILSVLLGEVFPSVAVILLAMLLGSLSYGVSIALFILAMRGMGAARTSTLFGTAPFAGAVLSIILLGERPEGFYIPAFFVMILGAWLLFTEKHVHTHLHVSTTHEHSHTHDDDHHEHAHEHDDEGVVVKGLHTHIHRHVPLEHVHPHSPDLHHRHDHLE
jgi:drug/metabolite transporter (DMT)-like permease